MGEARAVGVAMSGGGLRATAWGLGSVAGLVRARELEIAKPANDQQAISVVSIASVSGGSIANSALATWLDVELDDISLGALLANLRSTVRHIAFGGLIRYAKGTNKYVALAFAALVLAVTASAGLVGSLVALHRSWSAATPLLWGAGLGFAVFAVVEIALAIFRRSVHPAERFVFAVAGLGSGLGFGAGAAMVADDVSWPAGRVVGAALLAGILGPPQCDFSRGAATGSSAP